MRARVDKRQAREGLLDALSCRPGAECARPIITELIEAGVITDAKARNFVIRQRYWVELQKPGITPARALATVCTEFDLSDRTVRDLIAK